MRIRALSFLCVIATSVPLLLHGLDNPLTVGQIVERSIRARGGRLALEKIHSLSFIRDPDKSTRPSMIKMRPHYLLVGCTQPTCDWAEGYDGSAWEMSPRKARVIRAKNEAAKALHRVAEFDDSLIDYGKKGHRATLAGIEEIFGRRTYRIEMVLDDGLPMTWYIDCETWLPLANRRSVPVHARGAHIDTITKFEDFRPVAGFLYPFRLVELDAHSDQQIGGRGGWRAIEANLPYPTSLFTPPRVSPPPITKVMVQLLAQSSAPYAQRWFAPYRAFRAQAQNKSLNTEEDLNWLGYELLKENAYEKAFLVFTTEVEENPGSHNALDSLGDAYAQAGQTEQAIETYEKSLKLEPKASTTERKLRELISTRP